MLRFIVLTETDVIRFVEKLEEKNFSTAQIVLHKIEATQKSESVTDPIFIETVLHF